MGEDIEKMLRDIRNAKITDGLPKEPEVILPEEAQKKQETGFQFNEQNLIETLKKKEAWGLGK